MAQTKPRGGKRAAEPKRQKHNEALDACVPDEEVEFRALTRALELAQGFKLIFVRCNQPAQRGRLTAKLRQRLPKLSIECVEFKTEIRYLLDELRLRFDEPPQGAVFVAGLEYSMPKSETAHATHIVANLNAARNSFPVHIHCPLVLWLPEYALTAIQRGAPDFFSVRSGAYYFAATPEETAGLAQSQLSGNTWAIESLPLEEKLERVTSIKSLLDDYESLPSSLRDRRGEGRLLSRLGIILFTLGRWTEAEAACHQGLVIAREFGDTLGEGQRLGNLGNMYLQRGNWEMAEVPYNNLLTIFRELGDRVGEGQTLNNLGAVYRLQGKEAEAEAAYQQSLTICREFSDRVGEGRTLGNLGVVYQLQGKWAEVEAMNQQALTILREFGDRVGEEQTLGNLGVVYMAQGKWAEAEAAHQQSLKIRHELGDRVGEGRTLFNLSLLKEDQGDFAGALEFAMQSVAVLETTEAMADLDKSRAQVAELEEEIRRRRPR